MMDHDELQQRVEAMPYWYHKIELPGGIVTPGYFPINPDRYCLPPDLTGLRVLDIGAWDGYWTFEALRRGAAEVVAIDDFSDRCGSDQSRHRWETFDLCREALGFTKDRATYDGECIWENDKGQKCLRYGISAYDVSAQSLGSFDVVFFFGTIYHLKHPLLALQKISDVCKGALYVETASLDEASPYRGGIGAGFSANEMVMEYYPGREYADNPTNWWVPTLQCLGAMIESVGFHDVQAWPLTETPQTINECRGFASGTKDPNICPALHPDEVATAVAIVKARVAAVMSVPRLGFQDNMSCAFEALQPLRIPLVRTQGAFWGQCLERGMMQLIDGGIDLIVTMDYDSVFRKDDVEQLLRLALQHPEATAIVPVQKGRGEFPILMSITGRSGQVRSEIPITELKGETMQIASGHFGLTVLRVDHLLDIPHPWFWDQPNGDGMWGSGRVDADIYFWKQLQKHKRQVLLACHVPIGHIEAMITWPDENMQPIHQHTNDWATKGKPANVWK